MDARVGGSVTPLPTAATQGFDTLRFPDASGVLEKSRTYGAQGREPVPGGSAVILAIDIGGTKFSMAVFEGHSIVRRERRATDAAGGRQWMVAQIAEIAGQ